MIEKETDKIKVISKDGDLKDLLLKNKDTIMIILFMILMLMMYKYHLLEIQSCNDFWAPQVEALKNPLNLSFGWK